MKISRILILSAVLLSVFFLPASASAQGAAFFPNQDDKIVFGGEYTLREGETLNGDLISFGGQVTLEEGSTVTGSLISMGGNVEVAGLINGDLVALGSNIDLHATAVVRGDLALIGANANRDSGAQVLGDVVSETPVINWDLSDFIGVPNFNFDSDSFEFGRDNFGPRFITGQRSFTSGVARGVTAGLLNAFVFATLAVLIVLFLPVHTRRISKTTLSEPIASGGIALLSFVVIPVLAILLTITILLIPVTILLFLLVALALCFGWVAFGWEVGKRLLDALNLDWAAPVEAGAGTFVLTFAAALVGMVPCIGWFAGFLVLLLSFGGVLLSRFGTQEYPALEEIEVIEPPKKAAPKKKAAAKKAATKKSTKK